MRDASSAELSAINYCCSQVAPCKLGSLTEHPYRPFKNNSCQAFVQWCCVLKAFKPSLPCLTKLQKAIPKGQLVETRSAAVKYTHKETIKDMSSLKDTQDEAITYGKQQKKYKTIYLHLRSISSPGTDENLSSIAPLCPGSFDRPASSFTTA